MLVRAPWTRVKDDPPRSLLNPSGSPRVELRLNPLGPLLMIHLLRDQRRSLCAANARIKLIVIAAGLALMGADLAAAHEVSPERLTPIVVAVRKARVSVVSIKGQKTITESAEPGSTTAASDVPRQVNGMGTGTI